MDRYTRGFLAGAAGGIAMNAWSFTAYYGLGLPIRRFLDWAGIMLYGNPPQTLAQGIYALVMQIVWAGFLGILLSLIMPSAGARYYLLKGAGFGLISGFVIYAVPILLRTPYLGQSNFITVLSNHFGAIIWGLVTGLILKRLDRLDIR